MLFLDLAIVVFGLYLIAKGAPRVLTRIEATLRRDRQ